MKAGLRESPPVPPPRQLRPVLTFARLGDRALLTVATVLDSDDELRDRVRAAVNLDDIDPTACLFLERPDGWREELDAVIAEATAKSVHAGEKAEDRRATRRLAAVEEEARVLSEALEAARDQLTETTRALTAERTARIEADRLLGDASTRVARLERERDAAHRRAAAADRELDAVRATLAAERADRSAAAEDAARRHVDEIAPSVRAALAEAAAAADEIRAALRRVTEAVDAVPRPEDRRGESSGDAAEDRPRPTPPPRRRPAPIPAGLLAESDEAADHLVRLDGVRLIVDGYNASLRAWEHLPLSEQRRRLVDAATELAARCGASITVVFDGAQEDGSVLPVAHRDAVDVRFTASHVEADDAILDLVDAISPARPVVVASDDRRVRDGSERRGANVLTQRQLFGLLRRDLA